MGRERSGTIELWRFVFSFLIVITHAKQLGVSEEGYWFPSAAIGVEFFFLVTGYLMAQSVHRMLPLRGAESLGMDTVRFLWKKIKRMCPNYYIAWAIGFAVYLIANQMLNISAVFKTFCNCIFELTFMTLSGLIYMRINGAVWYISAMLIAIALIYPLLRRHYDFFQHVVAPIAAILILGYLMKTFGHLRTGPEWHWITYKGNLRAIAEICLGISMYPLGERLRAMSLTTLGKIAVTAIESAGYLATIVCCTWPKATKYDFLIVMLLAVSISLSFSGQGIHSALLQNPAVLRLGEFSFSLYLSHVYYAKNLGLLLPGAYEQLLVPYLLLSFCTALFVMYSSNFVRAKTPAIKEKLVSLLIVCKTSNQEDS